MEILTPIFIISILLTFSCSSINSQQPYARKATTNCGRAENSTSVLGYSCNGISQNCQAYLTFRAHPPFTTVSSISSLLAADPSQLSRLNSIPETATFSTDQTVLVPVNCSCNSGRYYQANASYVVRDHDTPFVIANNTFQGLSTCQAFQDQNGNGELYAGTRINVPLRCACPTRNQTNDGVKYLLSYLVSSGQYVYLIGEIFGVDTGRILEANGLSDQDSTIYPFTTLLIPLTDPPRVSQILDSPPPPPPPPPPQTNTSQRSKTWIYAVAASLGGLVLVSIIFAVLYYVFIRRKKRDYTDPNQGVTESQRFKSIEKPLNKKTDDQESEEFWESLSNIAQSVKIYSFEEIQSATKDFSPDSHIKGSVFRGVIREDHAAIKKMSGDVSSEINLLSKINHFNLIRLSGVCFNDGHWYLVYEYAANGSLAEWIHHKNSKGEPLSWKQRMQILLDVATVINYLHSYASPPHVHKDLNSGNILLDGDFRAKVANFGLARSAEGKDGEFALTRHIVGTKGYMSPEYLENGFVSPKLDVYAFGVVVMETLSGRDVAGLQEEFWGLDLLKGHEDLRKFMDSCLKGNYPTEVAMILMRLAEDCVNKDPFGRPNMGEIANVLSRTMATTMSWELSGSISK